MRANARIVAVVIALLAAPLTAEPAAAATSPIQFGRIFYDSPGADTRSAASLNAEYVVVRNVSAAPVSLAGWSVTDVAAHRYTFGSVRVPARGSLTLHTGRGAATAGHVYWGSGAYIWNNPGDTAYLAKPNGTRVDTCAWSTTRPGYTDC